MGKETLKIGMEIEVEIAFTDSFEPYMLEKLKKNSRLRIGDNGGSINVLIEVGDTAGATRMGFAAISDGGDSRPMGTVHPEQILSVGPRWSKNDLEKWLGVNPYFSGSIVRILENYNDEMRVELGC